MEMTNSAPKSLTFEEILENPSLERFHRVTHFFMENENKIIFPDKFMASLKSIVGRDLQQMALENPHLSLSKVVATMLEGMNEDMTADMIKDITAFILNKWENRRTVNAPNRQELA
jgi:hypothetical protein